MDAVARDAGDPGYAPFRADAGSAPVSVAEHPAERAEMSPEQFWKRASGMLDKLNRALTPQYLRALSEQSDKVRERLQEALQEITEKVERELA
jgi:hypothetical protein